MPSTAGFARLELVLRRAGTIWGVDGYEPRTYGDAMADIYDSWYGDRSDTDAAVEALERLATRDGPGGPRRPVLELGVGTGRLALPLRSRGVDVWGIDASPAMVERLRAKTGGDQVPVAIGDMTAVDLSALPGGRDVRFGVVFVAINTFFNITSKDAQARCLQRVASVLEPDGVFVVEAFVPAMLDTGNVVEARTVAVDHVILSATRHDPDAQLVECQFIEIRESGITMRPLMIRYAPPAELDAMAAVAGLRLLERWSDWRGTPFGDGDDVHVSVYGRH